MSYTSYISNGVFGLMLIGILYVCDQYSGVYEKDFFDRN